MASLLPDSLVAIPSNISCASYEAMYDTIFLKSNILRLPNVNLWLLTNQNNWCFFCFSIQTHWSSAKFDIAATGSLAGCALDHGVIRDDICTYVSKRSADKAFQKSLLPPHDGSCTDMMPLFHFSPQTGCSVPDSFMVSFASMDALHGVHNVCLNCTTHKLGPLALLRRPHLGISTLGISSGIGPSANNYALSVSSARRPQLMVSL